MSVAFKALVKERYMDKGMSAATALALVHVRSDVSMGTLWTAFRGFRVSPESAKRLQQWALAEHGIEDLDVTALVMAPVRPRRAG